MSGSNINFPFSISSGGLGFDELSAMEGDFSPAEDDFGGMPLLSTSFDPLHA